MEENRIRRAVTTLWQEGFGKLPDGRQRSFLDQLSVTQPNGKINLQDRVFTSKPLPALERIDCEHLVAARLDKPPDAIAVRLVEIATTSGELVARLRTINAWRLRLLLPSFKRACCRL